MLVKCSCCDVKIFKQSSDQSWPLISSGSSESDKNWAGSSGSTWPKIHQQFFGTWNLSRGTLSNNWNVVCQKKQTNKIVVFDSLWPHPHQLERYENTNLIAKQCHKALPGSQASELQKSARISYICKDRYQEMAISVQNVHQDHSVLRVKSPCQA